MQGNQKHDMFLLQMVVKKIYLFTLSFKLIMLKSGTSCKKQNEFNVGAFTVGPRPRFWLFKIRKFVVRNRA